ncbi:YdcF family protein [Mumia sp. zg.B17]|uniref:SanA/YdcF family protein n=1 Tax=unclassified Mumia TaxID=2621872 RepID=UPI001C6F2155|nr:MULTISPECIES: ElyC/SanA/YdcF family protein [unclassified Mumia]MBW9205809.1 YdcF family protein [Mumia sp. zg.B17]MDD9349290.1 ElyC/SanA/YdcF family protein [Mumia sp.]
MNRTRRAVVVLGVLGLTGIVLLGTANAVVLARTDQWIVDDPDDLPHAQVAIVPGSLVRPDGTLGAVVRQRVDAAVALYEAGTVDKILVSGDNGTHAYNEPDTMRDAVLAAGVPPEDVFTDYAGFNTWHTMLRAREVFGVSTAVVVTQDFHIARAVDLARNAGLEAYGLGVGDANALRADVRELLARVRGLGEATVRPDVVLGPPLPIEGDGRDSWAPDRRPPVDAKTG